MKNNKGEGFSLIELIVVILVLSVLVVSAGPSFDNQDDFSATAERDQLIGLLRSVQSRAMQNTEGDCHRVIFTSSQIYMAARTAGDASGATCDLIPIADNESFLTLTPQTTYTATNIPTRTVNLDGQSQTIAELNFNGWGNPNSAARITITFDNSAAVCIESQGYIHACS